MQVKLSIYDKLADFIRDCEPTLARLNVSAGPPFALLILIFRILACPLIMYDLHTIFLAENPCKPNYDKWRRQILAEKHE